VGAAPLRLTPLGRNYSPGQGTLPEGEGSVRLTSLCLLVCIISFYIENIIFPFYKTSYPNEEVNRTEPSPSVSFPCPGA
jgi:hypothetical protein